MLEKYMPKKKHLVTVGICLATMAIAITTISKNDFFRTNQAFALESTVSQQEGQTIREKMLNAVDNFNYAKGSFTTTSSSGAARHITFEVQEGTNAGSNVLTKDSNDQIIIQQVTSNQNVLTTNEKEKSYTINKIPPLVALQKKLFFHKK